MGLTAEEKYLHQARDDFDDHAAFCSESLQIRDKRGVPVEFIEQPAQRGLTALIDRQRKARKPVRILVLKARQVMISSGTASHVFKGCAFTPGQKAMIVSHEADSTENIYDYYRQLQEGYKPFRGVVATLAAKVLTGDHSIEWEGGGYVKVATANNLKTGRSFSLRFLHLSEFAFWKDAKTLMTGLMQAVPDDPDTCVVIESTANGVGGEFYRLWKEASDPNNASEWVAYFFAWFDHPEYVRPPADPAAFQASLTADEQRLRDRYSLSLAQLNWRRWAIINKCQGDPETFKQEYPSNPDEAFLKSGRPRFSLDVLEKMPVIQGGGTVGELQEVQLGPRQVLRFFPQERGAMMVYQLPKPGHTYVAGADIAEGLDGNEKGGTPDPDFSVLQILDRATGEQVAKLRGRIEPAPFADYADALLRYYNWAYIVPEANGPGIAFLEGLLRAGYPPGLIYHRKPSPDEQFADQSSTILSKLGWKTSSTSRILLISDHDARLREYSIFIRDPYTLAEHESFVIKSNGKAEHAEGCHDDEVIALALAGVGMQAAPADRSLQPLMKARPPGAPQSPGTVKRYGERRLPERGSTIRF